MYNSFNWYSCQWGTILPYAYPVHYCQCNAHIERAVRKVNSLWTVDEDAIIKWFNPVGVTALQFTKYDKNCITVDYGLLISINGASPKWFDKFLWNGVKVNQLRIIPRNANLPDSSPQLACTPWSPKWTSAEQLLLLDLWFSLCYTGTQVACI